MANLAWSSQLIKRLRKSACCKISQSAHLLSVSAWLWGDYAIIILEIDGYGEIMKTLKELREEHGYTQKQVAEKIGVSESTY